MFMDFQALKVVLYAFTLLFCTHAVPFQVFIMAFFQTEPSHTLSLRNALAEKVAA